MRQKAKVFGEYESDENSVSHQFQNNNHIDQEVTTESAFQSPKLDEQLLVEEEKPTQATKTKKGKRGKKNTKQNTKSTPDCEEDPLNEPLNLCVTCQTEFPSRNKLFQHLKSTGHSLPLGTNIGKSKKNRKR